MLLAKNPPLEVGFLLPKIQLVGVVKVSICRILNKTIKQVIIMNVRKEIEKYLSTVNTLDDLKRAVIAENVGCSIHQVSRQASDLVNSKKESLQCSVKVKSQSNKNQQDKAKNKLEIEILNELKKINNNINSLEKRIKKMESENWITNDGTKPPNETKLKVRYFDGSITVCYPNDVSWQTLDYAYNLADQEAYSYWQDYLKNELEKRIQIFCQKTFPKLSQYNLIRSCGYNCLSHGDDDYNDFIIAQKICRNQIKVIEDEITKSDYDKIYNRYLTKPRDAEYIESYKIVDESNSLVMKKLNEIQSQIKR